MGTFTTENRESADTAFAADVILPAGPVKLDGELIVPSGASGLVVFAHGSGSSRKSPRNRSVAEVIRHRGIGTLLLDLLTKEEESVDIYTRHLRFDIPLLAARLTAACDWAARMKETADLNIGLFGASTGAAAALIAAASRSDEIKAVVSRGGRPDLAGGALPKVKAPVLLIVGGLDETVLDLNQNAYAQLNCERELRVVPGATHLFEEPGTLEQAARLAADWFARYL